MSRSREPLANTSLEAVALRKAAFDFAAELEPTDADDKRGQVLNRELLAAARAYAAVAAIEQIRTKRKR